MNKALKISIVVFLLVFATALLCVFLKKKSTAAKTKTVACSTCTDNKIIRHVRAEDLTINTKTSLLSGGMIECLRNPHAEYNPRTKKCNERATPAPIKNDHGAMF